MEKQQIDLTSVTQISIAACPGNLLVRGGGTSISVQGDPFEIDEEEEKLSIKGEGNLRLKVPSHVALSLRHVAGDLLVKRVQGGVSAQQVNGNATLVGLSQLKLNRIDGDLVAKRVDGTINIEHVVGDAVIRNAWEVNIGNVNGDCVVRNSEGPVQIGEVDGDLNIRRVGSEVEVGKVHRDISLREIEGNAQVGHVAGDARLGDKLDGDSYTLQADGDIVLHWLAQLPLHLTAQAASITNRLPLEEVTETEETLEGRIGKGGAMVSLTANGRIVLKPAGAPGAAWEPDFDHLFDMADMEAEMADIGQRIAAEVEQHVSQVTAELESQFGEQFAHLESRFGEQFAQKMERAARKAERAAEKATRKARRHMQKQARRQRRTRSRPAPKAEARPRATAEEQKKILKMVENGTISPEEANMLLEALEG